MWLKINDHTGRLLQLEKIPQRIISLCPSQTETLMALGVNERLIGITKFCVHPKEKFLNTVKVGGTKKVNYSIIQELNPDLIICAKEENTEEMVNELSKNYPVFVCDIESLNEIQKVVTDLGVITGTENAAQKLNIEIQSAIKQINPLNNITVAQMKHLILRLRLTLPASLKQRLRHG